MDGLVAAPSNSDAVPGRADVANGSAAREWRVLHRLEKGAIGERGPDGIVTVRRQERATCFLFGPFWRLPGGSYRLRFACRASRPRFAEQPVLGVEVIALNRNQQAWRDFTAAELADGGGEVAFEVPQMLSLEAGEEARFEFRFFHLGNAELTVSAVDLRQLDGDAAPFAPPVWRLLGRCVTTVLGRRGGDGTVRVRRFEAPGVVLQGTLPYLRLPEGRYRLTLSCRASRARASARPVVGVELLGQGRWRWQFPWSLSPWQRAPAPDAVGVGVVALPVAALGSGSASADFVVPLELSLDSGDDASVTLRLRHFGNADLTIGGIELRRLDDEDEPSTNMAAPAISRSGMPARRNVLLIGNCQAETIRQGFRRAPALTARFKAKYHFVGLQKNLCEAGKAELRAADLILVQDIKDWDSYPLREFVPDGVEVVKFPLLHFASLWPFDHYNGPGDREAYEREWPNLTFLYQDGLLARLRREITDQEERFRAYRTLQIQGLVNYVRMHQFESRRLLAVDRQFGCEIGRYVLDNFQTQQLFYTTNHPNRVLMAMLMRWLMRRLGIDEPCPDVAEFDHLRRLQVPIHPQVARALGVAWADEATTYLYEGKPITWEAYTRAYIAHYG